MNEFNAGGRRSKPEPKPEMGRLLDHRYMQQAFQTALAPMTDVPIEVTHCKAKAVMSRRTVHTNLVHVHYWLTVRSEGTERDYRLVGTAPATADDLTDELVARCREARDVPSVAPFRELAGLIGDVELAFHFAPVDLDMPALLDVSRPGCGPLLAPYLPECRAGARIERVDGEVKHYKPSNRAVLRLVARFAGGGDRAVYVKIFADDRGVKFQRDLEALWAVAARSRALRIAEPLGYDAVRRMQIVAEAPGACDLSEWIKRLENGDPLPEGVDVERVKHNLDIVAEALRDLHAADIPLEDRETFAATLEQIERDLEPLRDRDTAIARSFDDVLERLESAAPAEARGVPSHGAFRHKQMIGHDDSLTIIDWDGLRLAHPALDAATFLQRLRQEPVLEPGTAEVMESLADHFRRRVLALEPASGSALPSYEALLLAQKALRGFRRKARGEKQVREIHNLLAAARRRLEEP